MGEEIASTYFSESDFSLFRTQLIRETETLREWFSKGALASHDLVGGFEIESWLLDKQLTPSPINAEFLKNFANPLISPELARFNVEFNNTPQLLKDTALTDFQCELEQIWLQAEETIRKIDPESSILLIGTLPTLCTDDLNAGAMSDMNRYHALNDQIMARRGKKPVHVSIQGQQTLELGSDNVMLESSTTSLQIHTQVPVDDAHHYYNASLMISAPMVVLAANSPFAFGKALWDETRIPLFEQSIDTANPEAPMKRVSFGNGYVRDSILECFEQNLENFYILLPVVEEDNGTLKHLRLHNGTIWRWNRPLLGFDDKGTPHIRIEHRPISAGPTITDMMANAAFYFGLQHYWAQKLKAGYSKPTFADICDNFYAAAKASFECSLTWEGKRRAPKDLLQNLFIPQARQGLEMLGIASADREHYLSIIAARVDAEQNGAIWQRNYVAKHGCDMQALTRSYLQRQLAGTPVHNWEY